MKIVKLTHHKYGDDLYVNLDHIISLNPINEGGFIKGTTLKCNFLGGKSSNWDGSNYPHEIKVKETPEQIFALMRCSMIQ